MNATGTLTCPRCGTETPWPNRCDCTKEQTDKVERTIRAHLTRKLRSYADDQAIPKDLQIALGDAADYIESARLPISEIREALTTANAMMVALAAGKPTRNLDEVVSWIDRLVKSTYVHEGKP